MALSALVITILNMVAATYVYSSYSKHYGYCIAGYNYKRYHRLSKYSCMNYCNRILGCRSFDYRIARYGFNCAIQLHKANNVGRSFRRCPCGWSYYERVVSTPSGYRQTQDYCINGYNAKFYSRVSPSQCAMYCNRDFYCKSFDYRWYNGQNCAIHHYTRYQVGSAFTSCGGGWNYFERITQRVYQTPFGYKKNAGMCIHGWNIKQYSNIDVTKCARYCNLNEDCKSFDWRPQSGYNCALQNIVKASAGSAYRRCSNDNWSYYEKV